MGKIYDKLVEDVRFVEGIKACFNCGTCTAICAASEFYNYDPRTIADTVQTKDDEKIIEKGLNSDFSDYEDSLQYFSALRQDCDILITRNVKDFKRAQIPVMTPDEFLNSLRK